MALTATQVKNAPKGVHADGGGLYFNVAAGKSWLFRFTSPITGKRREMGIGPFPDVTLADAREQVATLRAVVRQGIDPIDQRNATKAQEKAKAQQVQTFATVAADYIAAKRGGWKNAKHADQWSNTLATYCADFNGKPVADVTLDDVEAALRPIWLSKAETASRVLTRVVCVLNYANDKGLRPDGAESWPRRLRENRLPAMPAKAHRVRHHPALPFDKLASFVEQLEGMPGMGAKALLFVILTACRSGEARLATWQEVDMDAAVWTIPAARMKAKREHRVPLSAQALALLRSIRPDDANPAALVFPGEKEGKPLSDMTLSAIPKRLKTVDAKGETVTPHGFRSSFRDWAAETTHYPAAVVEMALAHTVSNAVEAAYRRGDLFAKRRELMAAWADYCDKGAST